MPVFVCIAIGKSGFLKKNLKMAGDPNFFLRKFAQLRCPETLFISHETHFFLFSVFRVVQGEAKTPKIMGVAGQILHFYMP